MLLYSTVTEHASAQVRTARLLPGLAHVKGMLDFLEMQDVCLLADLGDVGLLDWLCICTWHSLIHSNFSLILADPAGQRPGPSRGSALDEKWLCQGSEVKLTPRRRDAFTTSPSSVSDSAHPCGARPTR